MQSKDTAMKLHNPDTATVVCYSCPDGFCHYSTGNRRIKKAQRTEGAYIDSEMCKGNRVGLVCSECRNGTRHMQVGTRLCAEDCNPLSGWQGLAMASYGAAYVGVLFMSDAGSSGFFKSSAYFMQSLGVMKMTGPLQKQLSDLSILVRVIPIGARR